MARRSKLGKPTRTGTTKKARTASAPIGAKQDGVGPNRALPVGQGAQPPGNAEAPSNVVLAVVSIDAFVAADRTFDLMVFPGERHGYRSAAARRYAYRRVIDYFVENL